MKTELKKRSETAGLQEILAGRFFMALDFDGTITKADVIDSILERFAPPEWKEIEALWEAGKIGSRQCLADQVALINSSLTELLKFSERFEIDRTFFGFAILLKTFKVPYAVISDGFQVFIERILEKAGICNVPVFANVLRENEKRINADFPFSQKGCQSQSAACKCGIAGKLANGLPMVLVGDGRSDFCLAKKADLVFSKNRLTEYCREQKIPHIPVKDFSDIGEQILRSRFQEDWIYERTAYGYTSITGSR